VDQSILDGTTLALLDEAAVTDLFSKRPLLAANIITKMRLKGLWLWIQDKTMPIPNINWMNLPNWNA
jgi:hypothetical protein